MIATIFKARGARKVVHSILEHAEREIESLAETREPKPPLDKYHPQKLGDEEVAVLGSALYRIVCAKEKLAGSLELQDLPIAEICSCDSVIRLLARESIFSIFDMWKCDPEKLKSILERSKPMGGRSELYLYFFINE